MGHSVGEAAKRSTAKGMEKKKATELTPEQTIQEIRNLRAGSLWVPMHYVDTLLAKYDEIIAREAFIVQANEAVVVDEFENLITGTDESRAGEAVAELETLPQANEVAGSLPADVEVAGDTASA